MSDRSQATGLEAVISQGARRRRHQFARLAKAAAPALAITAAVAFAIYVTVMLTAGRRDWDNILVIATGAAAIPAVAGSLLLYGTRRNYPVTVAAAVTVFAASLIVSLLSASRIPISFTGLALTLPATLFGVTVANIMLSHALRTSVAVLEFPGANKVGEAVGRKLAIVTADEIGPELDRVLIDPDFHHSADYAPILTRLYLRGIRIEPWPIFVESMTGRVDIDSFDMGDVSYTSGQILYYRTKRLIDLALVALLAIPALIIGGAAACYIYARDGGPVLFVQQRRGYAGSAFSVFKLRTMYKNSSDASTSLGDNRIIPGCGLIRQLRIDELPQLVNILRGNMSFIGPRPVAIPVAEELEARVPQYVNRQVLLPGLTGWAQVSQGYAETGEEEIEKLSYDLYYLKHVSPDLDMIVVFRTILTVLSRSGAR